MPLSLKNENILHLPFVIACSPNLQSAHQHGFQHVEVQIPIIPFCDFLLAGVIDLDKCEDNLNRVGQSRCQKTLRRPLVQLQQVGEAGCQYDRSTDGSNQAQALTTHRCGKCTDQYIFRRDMTNNISNCLQYKGCSYKPFSFEIEQTLFYECKWSNSGHCETY